LRRAAEEIWQHVLDIDDPPTDDFIAKLGCADTVCHGIPLDELWATSSGVSGFNGAAYRYAAKTGAFALFEFRVPEPDYYEILVGTPRPHN